MSAINVSPYTVFAAITPSDTVDIQHPQGRQSTDAIYVGHAGDIVMVREDGVAVTFKAAVAGTILKVAARRINATNTTATDLVALYSN